MRIQPNAMNVAGLPEDAVTSLDVQFRNNVDVLRNSADVEHPFAWGVSKVRTQRV